MSLFVENDIRNRAQQEMRQSRNNYKSKSQVLNESSAAFKSHNSYDIFLSHSSKDAELILGIKAILEDMNYSVYVDWVDDPQLDRERVNESTAEALRVRMATSKSLFYVTTENSANSKWMPWECGYFDGIKEKVAILPIVKQSLNDDYKGREYLGLYPYCIKQNDTNGVPTLWIHKNKDYYTSYNTWLTSPRKNIPWRE